MKKSKSKREYIVGTSICIVLLFSVVVASCKGQDNTKDQIEGTIVSDTTATETSLSELERASQKDGIALLAPPRISDFVRRIHQDKSGNLWFGTNGDGVIRHDGESLKYFSIKEGFGGLAVRGMVEDKEGTLWFGTERGLAKFDPSVSLNTGVSSFTNFTEKDGLINNDVWSILIDKNGLIWIATFQGVCHFDGKVFTPFTLPETEPDPTRGVTSARIVHSIMEDRKGNLWFGTNRGAYIYDPVSEVLSNLSEKDGLCNNSVNDILEDKDGNIWFATHHKGISRYDGKSFTNFTEKGVVSGNEVWSIFEDKSGNIWFPAEGYGVYRYDLSTGEFTNFNKEDGLASDAIQCIYEDKEGRIWLGGWMGLNRYDPSSSLTIGDKTIFPVSTIGPWQ